MVVALDVSAETRSNSGVTFATNEETMPSPATHLFLLVLLSALGLRCTSELLGSVLPLLACNKRKCVGNQPTSTS